MSIRILIKGEIKGFLTLKKQRERFLKLRKESQGLTKESIGSLLMEKEFGIKREKSN